MKTAWLVTWEWVGEHAERKDKVASILNYRLSEKNVAEYMERLYADSYYSLSERGLHMPRAGNIFRILLSLIPLKLTEIEYLGKGVSIVDIIRFCTDV